MGSTDLARLYAKPQKLSHFAFLGRLKNIKEQKYAIEPLNFPTKQTQASPAAFPRFVSFALRNVCDGKKQQRQWESKLGIDDIFRWVSGISRLPNANEILVLDSLSFRPQSNMAKGGILLPRERNFRGLRACANAAACYVRVYARVYGNQRHLCACTFTNSVTVCA